MLGKRKRNAEVVVRSPNRLDYQVDRTDILAADDIFRKHFEAAFAPLPEEAVGRTHTLGQDSEDSENSDLESGVSEWSGLSESSNDVPVVEVVDHAVAENGKDDEFHRALQKKFMSSRPPRELGLTKGTHTPQSPDGDDPIEKINMKHDLDLQRLLRESYLLDRSKAATRPGKQRQIALDMRLQELGAKTSISSQQKMPMAHRKGIIRKTDQFETRRRKEAKENGVILEKATKKTTRNSRRDRGVDAPAVGKFTGGTLKLGRRDISSIQGPPPTSRRKGKRS